MGREIARIVPFALGLLLVSMPASAQVDLTGSWAAGVEAQLKLRDGSNRTLLGNSNLSGTPGLNLTAGLLVGHARMLLAFLNAKESTSHAKVISSPSVIATDSIPASITVGQEVPTLSSQAVSGVSLDGHHALAMR